ADQLLTDLDKLKEWPDSVKTMQRNWIGRSEGARVKFRLLPQSFKPGDPVPAEAVLSQAPPDETIEIFTTRPDTLFGVTFMSLAPEHPLAEKLVAGTDRAAGAQKFIAAVAQEDRFLRTAEGREKEGYFTGRYAINPVNGDAVPIYLANFVLMEYGTGAVMAVPAHDQRDFEFARKYDIPVKVVISPLEDT